MSVYDCVAADLWAIIHGQQRISEVDGSLVPGAAALDERLAAAVQLLRLYGLDWPEEGEDDRDDWPGA